MDTQKLYVAHFVLVEEDQWLTADHLSPSKIAQKFYVQSQLFAAKDPEHAYTIAQSWVSGFEDANHDGDGDMTRYFSPGLHELEELQVSPEAFLIEANQNFGVDVGHIQWGIASPTGGPKVREKHELAVFRGLRA